MPETHKAIPLTQHKAGAPKTESSWANKATVPQLISELKLVQNGVTTAKSSIVDYMTEII